MGREQTHRSPFRQARRSIAALVTLAALAALTPAGSGATTVPAAGYTQFAGCQHPGENPLITTCVRRVTSGGVLEMGNVEMQFSVPIVFSGGTTAAGKFGNSPKGGLLPAKQLIPGGVIGLTGLTWLAEFFGTEALRLYGVMELAAAPGDPLADPATLPIRVHLINSVLGNNCYIGSKSEPINLNLTTGTTSPPPPNSPITGVEPEASSTGSGIEHLSNGTYVDNAFSVPGANGCVLSLFGYPPEPIDETIDEESTLPSPAGSNETVHQFDTEYVAAGLVWP